MNPEQIEIEKLSPAEQDALSLTQAALFLEQAKSGGDGAPRDGVKLVQALNHNLEIWVAIRTLAQEADSRLPVALRSNLMQLSDFVAQATFTHGVAISDGAIDTLININIQLSEGLLEGRQNTELN